MILKHGGAAISRLLGIAWTHVGRPRLREQETSTAQSRAKHETSAQLPHRSNIPRSQILFQASELNRRAPSTPWSVRPLPSPPTKFSPAAAPLPHIDESTCRQTSRQSTTLFQSAETQIPCMSPAARPAPTAKYIRNTAATE